MRKNIRNNAQKRSAMKLTKRQEEIVRILKKQSYSKVDALAKATYISASSIRRDLQRLENLGIVERDYGGVRLKGNEKKNPPLQVRKNKDRPFKRELAQKASRLIRDGYTVMLDSSTTVSYLVDILAKFKRITVITNNLETALTCIERGISVYSIGGKSVRGMPVMGGSYAESMLSHISADIVFLSSFGIDENGTVSDPSEEENNMRRLMMRQSKHSVLLLDQTKIGRASTHILCSVHDFDDFITNDDSVSEHYLPRQN